MAISREAPPITPPFTEGVNTAGILQRLAAQTPQLLVKINRVFADIAIIDNELTSTGNNIKKLSSPLKQWSNVIQKDLAALMKEIDAQTAAPAKAKLNAELLAFKARATPLETDFFKLNKSLDELDAYYRNLKKLMIDVKNNAHIDSSLKVNTEIKESVKAGIKLLEPKIKEIEPAELNLASQFERLHEDMKVAIPKGVQPAAPTPGQTYETEGPS